MVIRKGDTPESIWDRLRVLQGQGKLTETQLDELWIPMSSGNGTIDGLNQLLEKMGVYGEESDNSPDLSAKDPDAKMKKRTIQPGRKIAVIGMSCRFPGSPNPEKFWKVLAAGRNCITEIPAERWDYRQFYSPGKEADGKSYSKWGGFIKQIDLFDPFFFKIAPLEASVMDPQQRLILELSAELLASAGYRPEEVKGSRTGIYLGAGDSGYLSLIRNRISGKRLGYMITGNVSANIMAGRISNYFDLRGNSLIMDTACSSSLVALHQACRAIMSGEEKMAIVGGVTLMLTPDFHLGFGKLKALSSGPNIYAFDNRADGFVLGEGAGLVLVKDYEEALRDGDNILAVIVGSALNNNGNSGITRPSLAMEAEVVEDALSRSGINPETISLYEAHGTGTILGDPIELQALTKAFRKHTSEEGFCAIGSVKANIGHLLRAAGIAGLIKLLLCFQKGMIPPTINYQEPNEHFPIEGSPFYPNLELCPWETRDKAIRRAAISSFGFGGTNAHAILEESPPGHQPNRHPLEFPNFNRKRHWL